MSFFEGMIFSCLASIANEIDGSNINYLKFMKTDNKNSEKDLNGNPESRLNTNQPVSKQGSFPESPMNEEKKNQKKKNKKNSDTGPLLDESPSSVGERATGTSPSDIAGVSDLDTGMRRAKKS